MPLLESPILQMVETPSLDDVNSFKPNKWGIPEPPSVDNRSKGN